MARSRSTESVARSASIAMWDLMVKDPEMIKSSYWNWLGLIDSFKRSSRMPPGCNLQ